MKKLKLNKFQGVLLDDAKDNMLHGICVSNLTYLIGCELGLDEKIIYELAIAGLLHGKMHASSQSSHLFSECN